MRRWQLLATPVNWMAPGSPEGGNSAPAFTAPVVCSLLSLAADLPFEAGLHLAEALTGSRSNTRLAEPASARDQVPKCTRASQRRTRRFYMPKMVKRQRYYRPNNTQVPIPRRINDWQPIRLALNNFHFNGSCPTRTRILRIYAKFHGYPFPTTTLLSPLKTSQVIYAVYNTVSKLIYVGYTSKTSCGRFEQHVTAARNTQLRDSQARDYPLSIAIANSDYRNWRTFPLEHIPGIFDKTKEGNLAFKEIARPRELFWMRRLHTYLPLGLNNDCPPSIKFHCKPVTNPLIFRKHAQVPRMPIFPTPPPFSPPASPFQLGALSPDVAPMDIDLEDDGLPSPPIPPPLSLIPAAGPPPLPRLSNIAQTLLAAPCNLNHADVKHYQKMLNSFNNNINVKTTFTSIASTDLTNLLIVLHHHPPKTIPHFRITDLSGKISFQYVKRAPIPPPPKRKLILFLYSSRLLDDLHLDTFLRDPTTIGLLPPALITMPPPLVTFKTDRTLGSRVFNYNQHRFLSFEEVVKLSQSPCTCSHLSCSKYRGAHDHISTTDLSIINHTNTRSILALGTKFRPTPSEVNVHLILEQIASSLSFFVSKLSSDHSIPITDFNLWSERILKLCSNKLRSLKNSSPPSSSKLSPSVLNIIKSLQKRFIFHPTDKSSQDFAITCLPFYYRNLIASYTVSSTYQHVPENPHALTSRHFEHLTLLKIKIPTDISKAIWLIPIAVEYLKAHKNPISYRDVAASQTSSLAPLSKFLTTVFKILAPEVETLWINTLNAAGIISTRSWILQNTDSLRDHIMKLNRFLKANNTRASLLSTYDFSTLYTTLPQHDLKIRMRSLLEQLFNAKKAANNKSFLLPSDVNPWRSKPSTSTKQKFWSHADISDALDYLIDNTFVSIGDRIFRQIIGIPMGTNCAVYLANFFLFTYELDFIRTLIAENKFDVLKAFANTFRYIDDVLPLNNPFFETYLPSINLPPLQTH